MLRKLGVVAGVLLVSGCVSRVAGPDAPPYRPDGPTRAQALLAEGLCVANWQLDSTVAEAKNVLVTPPDPTDSAFMSDSATYLRSVDSYGVESVANSVEALPESGIEAADRYASSLVAELTRVAPEIEEIVGDTFDLDAMSEEQRRARITQVIDKFESVAPEGPDLHTLARQDRDFAAVYDLAPHCLPLARPPSKPSQRNVPAERAADGTDLSACEEGTCEVAITGGAEVRAGSFEFTVIVADAEVRVVDQYNGGGTYGTIIGDVGGTSQFTADDEKLTITVSGLHEDTAVLKFDLS